MKNEFTLLVMCLIAIVNGTIACYKTYKLEKLQTQYSECVVDHDMAYMISPDMMYFIKDIGGAKDFSESVSEYDYE